MGWRMKKDSLNILSNGFYCRPNVLDVAKELLGKVLCTNFDGQLCKGKIVEVEAYRGRNDQACHANNGKRTKRTEVMYQAGGCAYIYLCYGIHHLFNVVTNVEGLADAVLIRALEPIEGKDCMRSRLKSNHKKLTNGPGLLTKSLGIHVNQTGVSLAGPEIWIAEGEIISTKKIVSAERIGIDYAEEDASLPWRFYIRGNTWVSKF